MDSTGIQAPTGLVWLCNPVILIRIYWYIFDPHSGHCLPDLITSIGWIGQQGLCRIILEQEFPSRCPYLARQITVRDAVKYYRLGTRNKNSECGLYLTNHGPGQVVSRRRGPFDPWSDYEGSRAILNPELEA